MKFKISKSALVNALGIVKNAAGKSLPILAHVRLEASGKEIDLFCTNLDQSLRVSVAAEVSKNGKTTTRAGLLHDLVKSFPAGDEEALVELELVKDSLRVQCEAGQYNLGTLAAEEFPSEPEFKKPSRFQMSEGLLRRLLAGTAPAMSDDDQRYVLCGALLALDGGAVCVSTDGRRLALMESAGKYPKLETILPRSAVGELLKLLAADDEKPVKVLVTGDLAQFQFSGIILTTKLIEGNYPNYRSVIPKSGTCAPVDREKLLAMAERLALLGDNCTLQFREKELIVSVRSDDAAIPDNGAEILPIAKTKGFKFNLQLRFLIDALSSSTDAGVVLSFTDPLAPLVIKSKDGSWLNCIMGLRGGDDAKVMEPEKAVGV